MVDFFGNMSDPLNLVPANNSNLKVQCGLTQKMNYDKLVWFQFSLMFYLKYHCVCVCVCNHVICVTT